MEETIFWRLAKGFFLLVFVLLQNGVFYILHGLGRSWNHWVNRKAGLLRLRPKRLPLLILFIGMTGILIWLWSFRADLAQALFDGFRFFMLEEIFNLPLPSMEFFQRLSFGIYGVLFVFYVLPCYIHLLDLFFSWMAWDRLRKSVIVSQRRWLSIQVNRYIPAESVRYIEVEEYGLLTWLFQTVRVVIVAGEEKLSLPMISRKQASHWLQLFAGK